MNKKLKHIITVFPWLVTSTAIVLLVLPNHAPQSCLDALTTADSGFTMASGVMASVTRLDVSGINYYNGQLNEMAPTYNEQKAACRGEGK